MKAKRKIPTERAIRQLAQVKAAFILQSTPLKTMSFNIWCNENDIDQGNASKAILGTWTGVKAKALRNRIIEASKSRPTQTRQVPATHEQSMNA